MAARYECVDEDINEADINEADIGQTFVEGEETEDDVSEQHDADYDINCYGADLDVCSIVRRFKNDDIYAPNFQRRYVWNRKQASRLIESILIGLPIPSLFFYRKEKGNRSLIIDGLQRLITIAAFFDDGKLPNSKSIFCLSDLPKESRFYGMKYSDLDGSYRLKFDDTIIHILFIQQLAPDDDQRLAFHIFERLNSGGTPLQSQEMRNALFEGPFKEHLNELNKEEAWRSIFGTFHKRLKDVELILRFLALHNDRENFNAPMKLFLNNFMNVHKNADKEKLAEFTSQFLGSLKKIRDALGNCAFRGGKSGSFSASYYDAFMVAVSDIADAKNSSIKQAYEELKNNSEFTDLARAATTDYKVVKRRIELAKESIKAAS